MHTTSELVIESSPQETLCLKGRYEPNEREAGPGYISYASITRVVASVMADHVRISIFCNEVIVGVIDLGELNLSTARQQAEYITEKLNSRTVSKIWQFEKDAPDSSMFYRIHLPVSYK